VVEERVVVSVDVREVSDERVDVLVELEDERVLELVTELLRVDELMIELVDVRLSTDMLTDDLDETLRELGPGELGP
jgi:hypothetical protein